MLKFFRKIRQNHLIIVHIIILISLFGPIAAQEKQAESNYILLKNARLIDAISNASKKGDILIKEDKIAAINYDGTLSIPSGTTSYDLEGHYIIPGLIDAHVHLGTDPSGGDNLEDTKKKLLYLLQRGVTSVRDMAGDTRYLSYLARASALNEIDAPDIYYASLMAGSTFFDDPRTHASARGVNPGNCAWMKAVDLNTNMPLAIAAAKGTGATAIKIYADLKADVIQKIVREAHAQNMQVWAHAAVLPAKPQAIVDAGVNVISHASLLAWEGLDGLPKSAKGRYQIPSENFNINSSAFAKLMQTMKQKGTILDATLAVYKMDRHDSNRNTEGLALTKLAHQNGVKIGVGTDNLNLSELPEKSPLQQEIEILVNEIGMTTLEALKAATVINAKIIGVENKVGSIEIGKNADLVILKANPLEDISNVVTIHLVLKHGRVYQIN